MSNEIIQDSYVSYVVIGNLHNVIKSIYAYNLMRNDHLMSITLESFYLAFKLYCFSTFVNLISKYDDVIDEIPYVNEDKIINISKVLGLNPENSVLGYYDLIEHVEYIYTFDYVDIMDAYDYMRNISINEYVYYRIPRRGVEEGLSIYFYVIGKKELAHAYSFIIQDRFNDFVEFLSKHEVIDNIKNKYFTKYDIENIYRNRNSLRLLQIDTSINFTNELDGFTINTIKSMLDIIFSKK